MVWVIIRRRGISSEHRHSSCSSSFWPSDSIWRYRTVSTLAQVMAWCLNRCWLIIHEVLWQSITQGQFHNFQPSISKISLKITSSKILFKSLRGQWIMFASLLHKSLGCPCASEVILKGLGKINWSQTMIKHNKAKTMGIFLETVSTLGQYVGYQMHWCLIRPCIILWDIDWMQSQPLQ